MIPLSQINIDEVHTRLNDIKEKYEWELCILNMREEELFWLRQKFSPTDLKVKNLYAKISYQRKVLRKLDEQREINLTK